MPSALAVVEKSRRSLVNLVLDGPRQVLQDLRVTGVVGVLPQSCRDPSLEILLAVCNIVLRWRYKRPGRFSCKDWSKFDVVFDHLPELVCHGLVPPIGNVRS
jgi:hypothetical protein